jgi:hypothetical protein
MKSYIYIQIIILLVFNFELLHSMETNIDETTSTPTSQMITEEVSEIQNSSDSDERSTASSISSGTEVADFSRDIIVTNRTILATILQKELGKKLDQDLIEQAIDMGLRLYDNDRGRYSILLSVSQTKETRQTQQACLNQLVEQINTKLQQENNGPTSSRQEPMRHPSDVKKTHIKRNVVIASLFCGVGICCLATGGLLVAAAWQSMEHFNN